MLSMRRLPDTKPELRCLFPYDIERKPDSVCHCHSVGFAPRLISKQNPEGCNLCRRIMIWIIYSMVRARFIFETQR
jgi:hypothetical protein